MPATKAAHPGAMAPKKAGATRVAAPMKPASWGSSSRMRVYTLFGLTGWIYLLASFVAIRVAYNLGSGPEAWNATMASLQNPIYIAFHVLCLVSVVFVLVRFFRLFPKAQPARIGPAKPPPAGVIHVGLYLAWIGITAVLTAILAGVIF